MPTRGLTNITTHPVLVQPIASVQRLPPFLKGLPLFNANYKTKHKTRLCFFSRHPSTSSILDYSTPGAPHMVLQIVSHKTPPASSSPSSTPSVIFPKQHPQRHFFKQHPQRHFPQAASLRHLLQAAPLRHLPQYKLVAQPHILAHDLKLHTRMTFNIHVTNWHSHK